MNFHAIMNSVLLILLPSVSVVARNSFDFSLIPFHAENKIKFQDMTD